MMQELGVNTDVIDSCLNPVLAGSKVRRHYLHHPYTEEMKEAWTLLGAKLTQILSEDGLSPA